MDKKKIVIYLAVTYLIAWPLQIIGSIYMKNNPGTTGLLVFQACLAACMFAPLLAALIANKGLKGMGWKPKFKGNIGPFFLAAYASLPLTFLGAALFFILFPGIFDTTGSLLATQAQEHGVDLATFLEQAGMDVKTLLIIQMIPAVLFAPFINTFTAIGEETGWRGFLYPELNKGCGLVGSWLIGGVCWSVFHFPAMFVGGYEYGFDYPGSPWLGPIVFTLFCISVGVLEERIYNRTKCIWYPALLHGSINAIATLPQLFMNANNPDSERLMILGPIPVGIIAMIPFIITAVIIAVMALRRKESKA